MEFPVFYDEDDWFPMPDSGIGVVRSRPVYAPFVRSDNSWELRDFQPGELGVSVTASIPEENYRVDFPIRSLPEGIAEEDVKEIDNWLNNGIRSFALSCCHYPAVFFCTRYEDGIKPNRKGGPAIIYPNGREEYWIRGRKIGDDFINKLFRMSAIELLSYPNIETRRDLIECLGNDRFCRMLKDILVEVNSQYFNGREYVLYKTMNLIQVREGYRGVIMHFLKVQDASTSREYYLQVPPGNDAVEALAWTFGKKKAEYNPVIET